MERGEKYGFTTCVPPLYGWTAFLAPPLSRAYTTQQLCDTLFALMKHAGPAEAINLPISSWSISYDV